MTLHEDDDVEVTIRIRSAAYERAWEIVSESDWEMRRRFGLEEDMTVQEYLATLVEQKLR